MTLDYYKKQLGGIPLFLEKYLHTPSLLRLKKVGYFCGMDYASKDVYDFAEKISRYDHSLTVALMTYKLTKDMKATIAGLFHDISTPCFAHVIDYMNEDYEKQESTEEYTEEILRNDSYLKECLKEDNISLDEIINFKDYPVVDNDRPKICADRLDGIILTSIGWTKNITEEEIKNIVGDMHVYSNESGEKEIGFIRNDIAQNVVEKSETIDEYCHSKEDNYMMDLLGRIVKLGIKNNLFTYEDLYKYDEEEILRRLINTNNEELLSLLNEFVFKKKDDINEIQLPSVKKRNIKPIVLGKRQ